MSVDPIQVVTTTASAEDARRIATALVEQRLAACVQIDGPLASVYRWEGRIETATEWRCVIKTRAALYPDVERVLRQLHTYDEPEILVLPVVTGSAGYLAWLARETQDEATPDP